MGFPLAIRLSLFVDVFANLGEYIEGSPPAKYPSSAARRASLSCVHAYTTSTRAQILYPHGVDIVSTDRQRARTAYCVLRVDAAAAAAPASAFSSSFFFS